MRLEQHLPTIDIHWVKGNIETGGKLKLSVQIKKQSKHVFTNALENQDKMGIAMTKEGIVHPICGKQLKKKGRKSLKELRLNDEAADNQQKITGLFNVEKGKFLPKESNEAHFMEC